MGNNGIMVSVFVITYNHEAFIGAAIESALRQKATFEYEIVIGEDCSKDGTAAICEDYARRYPDKIRYFGRKTNYGMMANAIATFRDCRGKYIAFLEGDDYWNDPEKLQKQVDLLEQDSRIGMVHSDFDIYYQSTGRTQARFNRSIHRKIPQGDIYRRLIVHNFIQTLTCVIRRELFESALERFGNRLFTWHMLDFPLWLYIAKDFKIAYLDESTATYRDLPSSASHFVEVEKAINFEKGVDSIKEYFSSSIKDPGAVSLRKIQEWHGYRLLVLGSKKHGGRWKYARDVVRFALYNRNPKFALGSLKHLMEKILR